MKHTSSNYRSKHIIINILFVPQYKTNKAKSQITNYELLINLEGAVYSLKCSNLNK